MADATRNITILNYATVDTAGAVVVAMDAATATVAATAVVTRGVFVVVTDIF